jgi:UDP-2,4-diacetamido-2,4,6-trideoxy-beta-L-altropyranose hydrolase
VTVTLRKARALDCRRVWEWSCSPEARAVSLDPRPVPIAEHEQWFRARIARDNFWIVEANAADIGVVRIDERADGAGRISIAIASAARGRGIGRRAVTAACDAWKQIVIAEVLADNAASRACFEACGFTARATGKIVSYEWSPACKR